MAIVADVPLFKESIAGLKLNIGNMLKDTFPDHKLYFANGNITTPSDKYIVVKRVTRQGNPNGLNLVQVYDELLEDGTKNYIYEATATFRIKFHKEDAMDDAYYLKMLLSTDEFHYTWWGIQDGYGITNISDVSDDPVSVDYVEWEEGAVFTFDCNYNFRYTQTGTINIEQILFTVSNGGPILEGLAQPFWITLGYQSYHEFLTDTNDLYLFVEGSETTPSGADFSQDW
ncbi:hypothetical protein VP14_018 [Vibrio phage VPMCC14]|nr:hypothetical protein VP14_018 [Vibrio phage VPMCC14]